jgi:hypothetical protein
LTVNNNSFWVLQLTRFFTFRIRDSIRVFSRRQSSRNKRVGAVNVIDGVGRVATRTTNNKLSMVKLLLLLGRLVYNKQASLAM